MDLNSYQTGKNNRVTGECSREYKYRRKREWEDCVPGAATLMELSETPVISVKIDPELDTTKTPFQDYETDLGAATVVTVKIEPDFDTTKILHVGDDLDRSIRNLNKSEEITGTGVRCMDARVHFKIEPEQDYGPGARITYPVKFEPDSGSINLDYMEPSIVAIKVEPDLNSIIPVPQPGRRSISIKTPKGHAQVGRPRKVSLDVPLSSCSESCSRRKRGEYRKCDKCTAKSPDASCIRSLGKIVNEPILENKSAAELIREYGPRIKAMWNASKLAAKKPPAKSSAERMREYRAWIKSLGEAGDPIAKLMAERAAEYTRRRRERIKALAEAGDPAALAVVKRATEYPRERRARIKALAAAGDPAATAMVKRATEYPRKRRARIKALAEAGDPAAKTMAKREAECMRKYRARKRELREAGDPAATAAAKRMTEYYREYRARKKAMRESGDSASAAAGKNATDYARKRRARIKALAEAGDTVAVAKAKRMTEYYRAYRARKRALREAGDPAAVAAAKRTAEYYRDYRARKKSLSENNNQSESPGSDAMF